METLKQVIAIAMLYLAAGMLFVAAFNDIAKDVRVLSRLNRWLRIMARLVVIIIWPVILVVALVAFYLYVMMWAWKNITK